MKHLRPAGKGGGGDAGARGYGPINVGKRIQLRDIAGSQVAGATRGFLPRTFPAERAEAERAEAERASLPRR